MVVLALLAGGPTVYGGTPQESTPLKGVDIPSTATVLEGIPTVRIDTSEGAASRRKLDQAEAAKSRLTVNVKEGQYYWTSRGNRPLRLNTSGAFTYLSSEPGHYIRLTRVKDRITYVEHVDMALGSVTWWGEIRIR